MMSIVLLSGCKIADESNVYYDNPELAYALIKLSSETEIPTNEFTFIAQKDAFWEWEDGYVKFEDEDKNQYLVKVYYNDADYRISVNGEILIDTTLNKEDGFDDE